MSSVPSWGEADVADQLSRRIVRSSWWGTALFSVFAVAAVVVDAVEPIALAVDVALFAAGVVIFLWALAVAAARSRAVEMGIGGLFFLAGDTAPRALKCRLLGALAVQIVVGLATASAKPFTELAGGVLVPMFGLALCGLWGAKLGTFAPRRDVADR